MTPQHNHRQPSRKRRLQGFGKAFARSLCRGVERVEPADDGKRFFNDAFKKEILVTGLDGFELSFHPETFVSALVDPHGTEGSAHRQLSTLGWRRVGCWPPPHRAEPFPDSPAIVGGTHKPA
jgi:hypothetical protein